MFKSQEGGTYFYLAFLALTLRTSFHFFISLSLWRSGSRGAFNSSDISSGGGCPSSSKQSNAVA